MKRLALKVACLKDCKETHWYMSLSKLFHILVPLYANVRWPEAVLYNGICNKSRLRVWRAWMLERLVSLSTRCLGARALKHFKVNTESL